MRRKLFPFYIHLKLILYSVYEYLKIGTSSECPSCTVKCWPSCKRFHARYGYFRDPLKSTKQSGYICAENRIFVIKVMQIRRYPTSFSLYICIKLSSYSRYTFKAAKETIISSLPISFSQIFEKFLHPCKMWKSKSYMH